MRAMGTATRSAILVRLLTFVFTRTYTHIHTYTYIYTHTHIHTHTRACCDASVYVGLATVGGYIYWFTQYEHGPQVTYYQLVRGRVCVRPCE
jgi:hypothetical protein